PLGRRRGVLLEAGAPLAGSRLLRELGGAPLGGRAAFVRHFLRSFSAFSIAFGAASRASFQSFLVSSFFASSFSVFRCSSRSRSVRWASAASFDAQAAHFAFASDSSGVSVWSVTPDGQPTFWPESAL